MQVSLYTRYSVKSVAGAAATGSPRVCKRPLRVVWTSRAEVVYWTSCFAEVKQIFPTLRSFEQHKTRVRSGPRVLQDSTTRTLLLTFSARGILALLPGNLHAGRWPRSSVETRSADRPLTLHTGASKPSDPARLGRLDCRQSGDLIAFELFLYSRYSALHTLSVLF